MTTWRTTVIMKTDIKGSTVRLRALPEADLDALLTEHRAFVSRLAAAHDGRIVKPEGDGFWVVFPSVTEGALAAMRMQEELRLAQPNRGDDRLAMRIVLTLGDVLHQEGALVGDAVVLAARIEEITPPDAIYLSAAAQLAVHQAEVRTALVDAFTLKGFPAPVPVYRIEQTHRTRVIADQYIVVTDLHGFSTITETAPIVVVEKILDHLLELVDRVCRECDGTSRFSAGDAYCLTFPDATLAMAAVEHLAAEWGTFRATKGYPAPSTWWCTRGRCTLSAPISGAVISTWRLGSIAPHTVCRPGTPGFSPLGRCGRTSWRPHGTSGSSRSTLDRAPPSSPRSRSTACSKVV